MKKTFWFCFWLLVGLILGALLAQLSADVSWLSWLSFGQSLNISPSADLVILSFSLQASMSLNVAQIICVFIAMFCYRHVNW